MTTIEIVIIVRNNMCLLLWTGLDWTGLDWTGLDWTGLDTHAKTA